MKHTCVACVLFFALSSMAFGCTPSPDKLCRKLAELEKDKDEKDGDGEVKKKDEARAEKDIRRCESDFEKMEDKQPQTYKCLAKCVDKASSFKKAVSGCERECREIRASENK